MPGEGLTPEASARGLTPEVVEELERLHERVVAGSCALTGLAIRESALLVHPDAGELAAMLIRHAPALLAAARSNAAALLAAEARGREDGLALRNALAGGTGDVNAAWTCGRCSRSLWLTGGGLQRSGCGACLPLRKAIDARTLTPKAAPPADALREALERVLVLSDAIGMTLGDALAEIHSVAGATLARSAPPAPAAPKAK